MEGIVYLLVRMACIFYLLYKVWCWKSRVDEICRLLYGKGAETGAETPVECPKDTGTEDVMGSTRFVYLDEDAGTGVAPYPEAVAVTQAVTADDLSLAGDVLMKVDGADRDVEKVCRAARTLFLLRGTCLFDLFVSQTGNMEAVTRLLEENLDENGQPLARRGKKGEFDWKTLL